MAKKGARTDCVCRFLKLSPKCAERLRSACARSSRGQIGHLPPAFAQNFSGPNAAFAPLFAPSIWSLTFFRAFSSPDVLEEKSPWFPRRTRTFRSCAAHSMSCARCRARRTRPCARHARAATRRAHVTRERRDVRARCPLRYHCSATTTQAPCACAPLPAPCAKTCAKRQRAVRAASHAHTAREVRARRPCLMSVRTEPRSESEPLQSGKATQGCSDRHEHRSLRLQNANDDGHAGNARVADRAAQVTQERASYALGEATRALRSATSRRLLHELAPRVRLPTRTPPPWALPRLPTLRGPEDARSRLPSHRHPLCLFALARSSWSLRPPATE